jgi:LacI family transcriptional regulator
MTRSSKGVSRRPTIIDVAKEAHVGVMTVSRVLNNYDTVRAATRAKVMKAIAKIGYSPNDAARMLKGGNARTVGLVVPDLSSFFADCFHAVQEVAFQHDFQTLVIATGKSPEIEEEQLANLRKHRVAGVIIVPSGHTGVQLKVLQESGIPIVALDRPATGIHAPSVLIENREGAEMGVRHLSEHGYKTVACVGFDSGSYTVRERFKGYEQAVRQAGLTPVLHKDIDSLSAMHSLVEGWKRKQEWPRAIFAVKHITTVFLIQALHRQKLRVPQDVALVGFDDFELAEVLGTPVTVVRQSPAKLARTAAEILFQKILTSPQDRQSDEEPVKMMFPAELVIRRSCGCAGQG